MVDAVRTLKGYGYRPGSSQGRPHVKKKKKKNLKGLEHRLNLIKHLFFQFVNATGSMAAALVATILRLLIGEPMINLPSSFQFPVFDQDPDSNPVLPVKTLLMLISLAILLIVSFIQKKFVQRRPSSEHQPISISARQS